MSDWVEIIVPAPVALTEVIADALVSDVSFCAGGVQVRSGEVVFWAPADQRAAAVDEVSSALAALAELGLAIDPAAVIARDAGPEAAWRDAWKEHFHTIRLTRQIVVVPSWESHAPAAGDLLIHLDPGQAFGTGAHATTQLVLGALQTLADDGARPVRILDVGCGSGILAIAALRLWPEATCMATDIDPLAVSATTDNAAQNGVAERLQVSDADLDAVGDGYDLVLANIQAHILRELAPQLAGKPAPGCELVLSGILGVQMEGVLEAYLPLGLESVDVRRSEVDREWCAARLRRPR